MLKRFMKIITLLVIAGIFVLYFYATDPDTSILKNTHFSATVILTLAIFVISIVGIAVAEFSKDFFKSLITSKTDELAKKEAEKYPIILAGVYLADAISLLAYSIIIAAAIISYNMG